MPFLNKSLNFTFVTKNCEIGKFKRRMHLNNCILDPLAPLEKHGVRFILAGGKVIDFCNNLTRAQSTGDYDLFFTDADEYLTAAVILKTEGYEILSEKNHIVEMFNTTLGVKIQLVKTMYSCPEDVIENFDIRACAVAYSDQKVWWINGALRDIKDKKVVIQNIRPYKLAWLRPFKYYSKGYTIAPTDLALISISYLLSMDIDQGIDTFDYFLDRTYQYNSALEQSEYDHFTDPLQEV